MTGTLGITHTGGIKDTQRWCTGEGLRETLHINKVINSMVVSCCLCPDDLQQRITFFFSQKSFHFLNIYEQITICSCSKISGNRTLINEKKNNQSIDRSASVFECFFYAKFNHVFFFF